jgi:hypothetical protein
MKFDAKRFSQLAGLPEVPETPGRSKVAGDEPLSEPRRLTEAGRPTSDEARLREIIRREARRMVSERLSRKPDASVEDLQQKKSLTEAITMGFAGVGFGGPGPVLGGPLTSARRIASAPQVEEAMFPSWSPAEYRVGSMVDDVGRDELEIAAQEELGLTPDECSRMSDKQLQQALSAPYARL